MVDDKAYHEGGVWYLDRWWPSLTKSGDEITPISISNKSSSLLKLKFTNLVTKRIVQTKSNKIHQTTKSKSGDILSTSTGKRFREELGEWWLREEDLTSSRRDTWPSRRCSPGNIITSSSSSSAWNMEEDFVYQEAVKHLWIDLDMARAYPEPEMMEYIMDDLEEDGVKLETVEEDMVMDLEPAREL